MRNKGRKFIAGLCLTLVIPMFIGGQMNQPKIAKGFQAHTPTQKILTSEEDFNTIDMEKAFSILP